MPKTRRPAGVAVSICAPLARQHAQADPAVRQFLHDIDEVVQVAPETVELPHDERVALA